MAFYLYFWVSIGTIRVQTLSYLQKNNVHFSLYSIHKYKIRHDTSQAAPTHTTTAAVATETLQKIFKSQKTMSENLSWLQGNHEQSPFTERLCVKSRCFFSISLQTMIGSILYFISCWAKYYLKILMNLTKSFIRDKENCR